MVAHLGFTAPKRQATTQSSPRSVTTVQAEETPPLSHAAQGGIFHSLDLSRRLDIIHPAIVQTTMSPPLPSEILDLIVDFLHNERDALKACCLVSKSWIHRTRRHLFVHVELTWKSRIKVWKEMFPDPFSSPARHTRCLSIRVSQVVIPVDTGLGGWIRTFSGVVRLHVDLCGLGGDRKISFVPLHGLSPTLKSLRLACGSSTPSSEIFGLVCSFPLLEDLALVSLGGNCEIDEWDIPSTSPKFTGSLDLRMVGGIGPVVHRLSELPSGLHFSKISVSCLKEDVESTVDLMSKCSDTLESLSIYYYIVGAAFSFSFCGWPTYLGTYLWSQPSTTCRCSISPSSRNSRM